MTPARLVLGVVAGWMAIVTVVAVMAFCAEAWGRLEAAVALNHSAWMFIVCGGLLGASGLVLWMAVALINEVRGGTPSWADAPRSRGVGRVSPRSLKP